MNTWRRITIALVGLLWFGAAASQPAEPAGMVKTLRGQVTIDRAGRQQPAEPGMPVFAGDRLLTGPDSSAGVTLRDDTRLAAGPDSTLLISEFRFDTTTHDGNFLVSMLKGTFNVITGLIARRNPNSAAFTTPTLSLGVRGTEFIVDVAGGTP